MKDPFQDAVSTFEELKKRFQAGDLSRQQFIDEMKKLRLKDAQGRYWMIGAQTGKWYYFDGRDWISSEPPALRDKGPVCLFCGFENKDGAQVCGRCGGTLDGVGEAGLEKCPECGDALAKPLMNCPRCDPKRSDLKTVEIVRLDQSSLGRDGVYAVRSIKPFSLFLVLGILGALAGAAYGAFAGATGSLAASLASSLPPALKELQGKMLGGVVDGLGGALAGLVLVGLGGFLLACLLNFVLTVSGGLKIRLVAPLPGPGDEEIAETPAADQDNLGFNLLK
jgi:hypothetical protein